MKLVYIENLITEPSGGKCINDRNYSLLCDVFGSENVTKITVDAYDITPNRVLRIYERIKGFNGGLTTISLHRVMCDIDKEKPQVIFLSTSVYGLLVKSIKRHFPKIEVITFFHNVEYNYARDANMKNGIGWLRSRLVSKTERMAVRYADKIIAMNQRDSDQLKAIYGKAADLLLPTSFKDTAKEGSVNIYPKENLELLFVGFNFFANLEGVRWFVMNVMPKLSKGIHLNVVGRNMEQNREELERHNVTVVGSVDNLADWYSGADIVVLPIFSGSGMKTKTAEAMMYGKPILATRESFEGYEIESYDNIGALCETVDDFIENIEKLKSDKALRLDLGKNARRFFLENYSYQKSLQKFKLLWL